MNRFIALFIACAALPVLAYAQTTLPPSSPSYTVSSGTLSSGYTDLTSPTNITYSSTTYLSPTIAPSGFSFSYFGQSFTDFKIGANGYILMDSTSTVVTKGPAHSTAPGYVISPCWTYLDPNGSLYSPTSPILPAPGTIGYEYTNGGVLTVEWKYVPTAGSSSIGVRMQCVIDTANGTIEFRYGDVRSGTSGVTGSSSHMVAISSGAGASQEIVDGVDSGYVSSTGAMSSYPAGRYIKFTPAGGTTNNPPSLSASTSAGSVTSGGSINVNYNDTLSSLGLSITADDADNDTVKTTVVITNLGSTGIDATEWESTYAATPYTLNPSTGTFNTVAGTTYSVTLTADDGQDTSNFTFDIIQAGAAPSIGVSDSSGSISPGASASGTPRDFGSQDTGSGATAAITITISNSGQSDLTLSNLAISGTDAGEFTLDTSSFNSPVSPGSSTTFDLAFDPTSAGSKVATVTFVHDDSSVTSPFTFEIIGTGTTPAPAPIMQVLEGGATGPVITYASGPSGGRDFGTVNIDAGASLPLTIYIKNNGNSDLTLGTPTVSSGEFVLDTTSMSATVAQGGNTFFTVSFDPSSTGPHNATISFTHNDATVTSPFQFSVAGTGSTSGGTPGGAVGGGSGGGGGGCVASEGRTFWFMVLALGAILGAWHQRRRIA